MPTGSKKYEVEAIIGHRKFKGRKEYLIRWRGYKPDDDTHEPESGLDCKYLLEQYDNGKGVLRSIQEGTHNVNDLYDKWEWIKFIENSTISGNGVQATFNIPPKRIIFKFHSGIKRTKQEMNNITNTRRSNGYSQIYCFQHSSGCFFDAFDIPPTESLAHFVNNSCEPNSEAVEVGDDIYIISKREIVCGEEITLKYNLSIDPIESPSLCLCLSQSCCGVMEIEHPTFMAKLKKIKPDLTHIIKQIVESKIEVNVKLINLQKDLNKNLFDDQSLESITDQSTEPMPTSISTNRIIQSLNKLFAIRTNRESGTERKRTSKMDNNDENKRKKTERDFLCSKKRNLEDSIRGGKKPFEYNQRMALLKRLQNQVVLNKLCYQYSRSRKELEELHIPQADLEAMMEGGCSVSYGQLYTFTRKSLVHKTFLKKIFEYAPNYVAKNDLVKVDKKFGVADLELLLSDQKYFDKIFFPFEELKNHKYL